MVGASKILTVSYGTFSCTLEGFDDSFSTMKAIAEYFRDLAADDRYFGAEPPTPDAEMLARIAEREIERRVEARFEGENVVLRAAESAAPAALTQAAEPESAPGPVAAPVADEAVEPAAEIDTAPELDDVAIQEDILAEDESVATDEIETPLEDDTLEEPVEVESAVVAETETATQDEEIEAESAEDAIDLSGIDLAEPEAAPLEDVAEEVEPTPVTHPDADSIAAKLQRIRAVVSPGEDNDDSIFVEDQHAETELDVDLTQATAEIEAPVEAAEIEDAEVAEIEEPQGEDDALDLSAVMSAVSEEAPATEEETIDEAPAERVFKVKSAELEAALAEAVPADASGEDDVVEGLADALTEERTETADVSDEVEGADEAEEASDAQAVDDDADAEEVSIFDEGEDESDLSPEEEAELMAELAEVARDTEAEGAQDRDGAAILASLDDPEPTLDRIMEKTNDALGAPESGRKREALSHLKAAVAATEADRKLGGEAEESTDETESYREDLAQVVRPKRATAASGDRARPERPVAPLKLVAEQRVDTESASSEAPATPVRPRRIAKVASEGADLEGGFAEFAENAGASELPDLLEAAAAYTAYVEGRENFTRPQVMRRAAAVAGKDGFSREDGLRSFGQLLREGKINKLSRGQFVVSEETRFRPDARIAGE